MLYGFRSRWRHSAVGQSLFVQYLALTAVLTLALIVQVTNLDRDTLDGLRILLIGLVAFAGFTQLVNIIQQQRRRRTCPHPLRRETD